MRTLLLAIGLFLLAVYLRHHDAQANAKPVVKEVELNQTRSLRTGASTDPACTPPEYKYDRWWPGICPSETEREMIWLRN